MLNKKKIIDMLCKKTLFTKDESKQAVDQIFKIIKESFLNEEDVYIVGFGKFSLEEQKARPVRNPRTMESMMLRPYKKIKFRPSKKISDELKNKGDQ